MIRPLPIWKRQLRRASPNDSEGESNGGAFGMHSELRGFLTKDVVDILETFIKLQYSLDTFTEILNGPPEKKSFLIL